jgi:hypothetical protein
LSDIFWKIAIAAAISVYQGTLIRAQVDANSEDMASKLSGNGTDQKRGGIMMKQLIVFLFALLGAPAIAHAAPEELYGKSVVVSWSENVESKSTGETVMQSSVQARTLSIYVSNGGRAFARLLTGFAKSGRRGTGMQFRGGGAINQDPEQAASSNRLAVRFEGQQLLVDTQFESGARRVAINFEGNYSTCNVNIIQGREAGAKTMVFGAGRRREVLSIQTATPSCSIREGNIFAGT